MAVLERYEWCNYWWEEANEDGKPRILLIGDSITQGYRSLVREVLEEKVYVDMAASSRAVDNPALWREINYMLEENPDRYKVIHFNNGLHGKHVSKEDYALHLEQIVLKIMERAPKAKLVLVTSTPITKKGVPDELDEELNGMVLDRNRAVAVLAEKYRLPVDDLYSAMLGKGEYRVEDGYHYNTEGKKAQGAIVAEFIQRFL